MVLSESKLVWSLKAVRVLLSLPPPSGSECGDSESESSRATTVLPGKPFPEEVATVLESLYIRGMTGWGKRHSRDIESAITSTGLQITQVKVC